VKREKRNTARSFLSKTELRVLHFFFRYCRAIETPVKNKREPNGDVIWLRPVVM